jgi:hypothetical protein
MKKNSLPQTGIIQVPPKVMQKWKERQSRGDKLHIHNATKLSRPTITKAINKGLATIETILAISKFYSSKKPVLTQDIELEALKILEPEI